MQVILLERVAKLGQMGDTVRVKDGFARNFLLPQGKALRSTKKNLERFETERTQLEARNLERRQEAEAVAAKLDGNTFVAIRQGGETGQLYGSVSTRDISETLTEEGFSVARSQVALNVPIKTIGLHTVTIVLHPEVDVSITMNIARSDDEAERQARGEDVIGRDQNLFEFEEEVEGEEEGDAETGSDEESDAESGEVSEADEASEAETEQPV
ncbi:MAG: 50S ribosomal protein L9 [Stappiaceae bacterium]